MTEELIVSTGVKFVTRDVPVMAFRDLQKRQDKERPHVPVVFIEDKEREEENPEDPEYQKMLNEWNESTEMRLMDFVLMTGTKAIEIPGTVSPIDSEDWAEENRYLGIDIAATGNVRYLQWVKYVACPTPDDITSLIMAAGRKLGVTEEDVADAASMFQNREERRANTKSPRKTRS